MTHDIVPLIEIPVESMHELGEVKLCVSSDGRLYIRSSTGVLSKVDSVRLYGDSRAQFVTIVLRKEEYNG